MKLYLKCSFNLTNSYVTKLTVLTQRAEFRECNKSRKISRRKIKIQSMHLKIRIVMNKISQFASAILVYLKQLIYNVFILFVDKSIMKSEIICDCCKQRTHSLFGLFDIMVCSNCHMRLVNSLKYVNRVQISCASVHLNQYVSCQKS